MSENIDGGSTESTDTSASNEVDAQLAEMHIAETKEPAEKPAEETAEKPEVKKVVPLQALHEERRERQRLQQELAAQRQMMERVNQRLETLMTPQKQIPDRETDGVGYLDHKIGELTETQRQILERDQQREQQAAQAQQYQRVATHVIQTAAAFEKAVPDFKAAVAHLNETRIRQLVVLGVPEDQAAVQANQELDNAALQWTVQGKNAAEVAYEFAKAQGYQPKTGQTPDQKIEAQQKGTAAAKSLGGGGAVAGKLTAQALADMTDEDFAKLSESDWRRAMGG